MFRPKKKERFHSGIRDEETRREFTGHRKHVRNHICECCGTSRDIQCAHLSWKTGGGMSLRSHDAWSFPACRKCHLDHQHQIGEPAFWRSLGKDPWAVCFKFAVTSPEAEVKAYACDVMRPIIDRFHDYDARIAALFNREAA